MLILKFISRGKQRGSSGINTHRIKESELRVLQWNTEGFRYRTTQANQMGINWDVDVHMIQEVQVAYEEGYVAPNLPNYAVFQDERAVTATYVRHGWEVEQVPLQLTTGEITDGHPRDTFWATAVWLTQRHKGKTPRSTVLLNVYRSCNGKTNSNVLHQYIQQIEDWIESQERGWHTIRWIIGGDFNSSHSAWGAKKGSAGAKKDGHILFAEAQRLNLRIENTGDPTWFRWNQITNRISVSWIDVTLTKGYKEDEIQWQCIQEDHGGDHFPILIDVLGEETLKRRRHNEHHEESWEIKDDDEHWEIMREQLEILRPQYEKRLEHIKWAFGGEDAANKSGILLKDLYTKAAKATFRIKKKTKHWKSWVNKKAQHVILMYKKMWRRMWKERRKGLSAGNWKRLRKLKKQRDKTCKYYKTQWLEHRFSTYGIDGKEGWQIASEVRGLNQNRGRTLPPLIDPETNEIVATTTKEKAELLLEHYHRFDSLPNLPENYCYRNGDAYPVNVGTFEYDETELIEAEKCTQKDLSVKNDYECLREIQPMDHGGLVAGERRVVANGMVTERRFTELVQKHRRHRWRRAKKKHGMHLQRLNAHITKQEIQRAIRSFSNNKANGPDDLDIRFFKKTEGISVEILHRAFNEWMFSMAAFPVQFKERWIVPLIKAGKPGNKPKDLRPVALTSYVGKIFEKTLNFRLVSYLIHLRLLSQVHFAYLGGRSTIDCVVNLVDKIQRDKAKKEDSHAVFFDFSAAYDCVRLDLLAWKLENEYFIQGPILVILKSFFKDRKSAVKLEGYITMWVPDVIGVPQGGSLSPTLFILYIDNLSIVDKIQRVNFGIYSDDLTIWTTQESNYKSTKKTSEDNHWSAHDATCNKISLQEGILFVQWFTQYHGLDLNPGKTQYKIFGHKHYTKETQKEKAYHLSTSGTLKDRLKRLCGNYNPREKSKSDIIELTEGAVKYLGIWLDDDLTFKEHVKKLLAKCNRVFHTIQHNLRDLWRIKGNIAWNILESCVLSLIDYSAVFMVGLHRTTWKPLETFYNKVIRVTFHSIKGTGNIYLQHQLYTLGFQRRLQCKQSMYFSHLIRAPRSGAVYAHLRQKWWRQMRRFITKPRDRETIKWPYEKCIMWKIMREAMETDNSDIRSITKNTTLEEIEESYSHYIDITSDWKKTNFEMQPFLDEHITRNITLDPTKRDAENQRDEQRGDELLVFTDGSVENAVGGYGYHCIRRSDYKRALQMGGEYADSLLRLDLGANQKDAAMPLSSRCSIDFCEAQAINEALILVKTQQETNGELMQGVDRIRIISDSQTVLRWITGTYAIKSLTMKNTVNDILWQIGAIEERRKGTKVILQWVHSHDDTKGNDQADELAKMGMQYMKRIKDTDSRWKFISEKAVKTEISRHFKEEQQRELMEKVTNSRTQRGYDYIPDYKWKRIYKEETKMLTRDQMRWVIGLRTGAVATKEHLYHKLNIGGSDACDVCGETETVEHLMVHCTETAAARGKLQEALQELYDEQYAEIKRAKGECRWDPKITHRNIVERALFPPTNMTSEARAGILGAVSQFGRDTIGYEQRRWDTKGDGRAPDVRWEVEMETDDEASIEQLEECITAVIMHSRTEGIT